MKREEPLINQCGLRALGIYKIIPNWCFGSSCNMHDLNYLLPGSRKKADDVFLKDMLRSIKSHNKSCLYIPLAYTYYFAVRLFSGFFRKTKAL